MKRRERILVNAAMHADGIKYLEEAGYVPVVVPEGDPSQSYAAVVDCVGMVANASLPLTEAFLERAPLLKVVGRMGVGYDTVDLEACRRRGIRVVNTPLPIIEPVAEHTILLLLAVARRLVEGDRAVRAGRWREPESSPGPELLGKTLGLVGMGNTGRRVAEIALLAFQMKVLYFDRLRRPEAEETLGAKALPLEKVLCESDFLSVHVNLSPETRHLIDSRAFSLMKRGAVLINVSRGPVVDEKALAEALRSGQLGGAGLDVFDPEPPGKDHPLYSLPNVVLTPHIAGASWESKRGCSMVVVDIVRILRGEAPAHPVA